MIFNSTAFLIFAVLFFGVYSRVQGRARTHMILWGSYVFYGWWDWRYLGLIAATTVLDYVVGLGLERLTDNVRRRGLLVLSISVNLGVLFIFKYFNFFAHSLQALLTTFGMKADMTTLHVLLPVGVSFYTFQSIAYTVDVYRKSIRAERDLTVYASFVAFFPQLVAGPIQRAAVLLPQLKMPGRPTTDQIRDGASLVIWGYFLKVFLADNMARIVDVYFTLGRERLKYLMINPLDPFILDEKVLVPILNTMGAHLTAPEIMVAVGAFAIQIYGDFAGYSNMARGLGKFFGVEISLNFRQPYLALNPSDLWSRWHISLSSWFRDYLYIPLGGDRHGVARTFFNLSLTMLLAGLWHGASWTFVVWGLYHGALLILFHGLQIIQGVRTWTHPVLRYVSWAGMLTATVLGWLIFRANDFSQLQYMLSRLGDWRLPPLEDQPDFWVRMIWVVIFACVVLATDIYLERTRKESPLDLRKKAGWVLGLMCLLLIILWGGQSQSFIYFQF